MDKVGGDHYHGGAIVFRAHLRHHLHAPQFKRGWISAEEGTSENNRRAKFYRLTPKGRKQLTVETGKWDKLAGAIARILRPSKQEGKS